MVNEEVEEVKDTRDEEEESDYYMDGLIDAWFKGPKTLKMRVKLHEILVEMKKKADIYAEKEDFDDEFMERGMERLLSDLLEEVYKFKVSRGD